MSESFLNGRVVLHRGDCLEVLREIDGNSIDSCVTDPPYGLQFMGREWDKLWRNETKADKAYVEKTKGELTSRARKLPDYSATKPAQMQEFHYLWAKECLRVLKPGAHLIAFSGTRTYHRMVCAIEDAGFEVRDQLAWAFGQGFPKSHNVGDGWGTALKPAWEPIVLARKPLSEKSVAANVLRWGCGAINIDGCRVATDELKGKVYNNSGDNLSWGGTYGKGAVEGNPIGRWPANLIHDNSEEVLEGFPETESGGGNKANKQPLARDSQVIATIDTGEKWNHDSGSAARFFYTAKADSDDRLGSSHPTVKPLDLMQYLVRLVTPKNGTVLDPFSGTGTTGEAAFREGMKAILIEREPEYQADIVKRMELALAGPDERRAACVEQLPPDDLPMFSPDRAGA